MPGLLIVVPLAFMLSTRASGAEQPGVVDQPYPGLPARTHRLSGSELKDLPDMKHFQVEPSRQFLIDWQWLRTGHSYFGRRTAQPHSGAHVLFTDPNRDLDPGKPETYPAIYAVADGIIELALGDEPLRASVAYGLDEREDPFSPSSRSVFTTPPLDPNQIREIIPLGNLNPVGGHVFPTDHIYFDYGHQPGLEVRAPAAGTVIAVRDQLRGDSKVEVRVDANSSYCLAHLDLEVGIGAGTKVSAGQKLGRAFGKSMLDFGASDTRVRLSGFINPERYPQPTLHTTSPLVLFTEPLRTQLYAKVRRKASDKDGKIDLDKPGHLLGNWFHETLSVVDSSRGDPTVWAKQLSFAYDVRDPSAVRVSIGGTITPAGLYGVALGTPDPVDVGVDTGLVKYRLRWVGGEPSRRSGQDAGALLVRLVGERSLKIEYCPEVTVEDVEDFTDKASVYER